MLQTVSMKFALILNGARMKEGEKHCAVLIWSQNPVKDYYFFRILVLIFF